MATTSTNFQRGLHTLDVPARRQRHDLRGEEAAPRGARLAQHAATSPTTATTTGPGHGGDELDGSTPRRWRRIGHPRQLADRSTTHDAVRHRAATTHRRWTRHDGYYTTVVTDTVYTSRRTRRGRRTTEAPYNGEQHSRPTYTDGWTRDRGVHGAVHAAGRPTTAGRTYNSGTTPPPTSPTAGVSSNVYTSPFSAVGGRPTEAHVHRPATRPGAPATVGRRPRCTTSRTRSTRTSPPSTVDQHRDPLAHHHRGRPGAGRARPAARTPTPRWPTSTCCPTGASSPARSTRWRSPSAAAR